MNEGALEVIDNDAPAMDHVAHQVIPLASGAGTLALGSNPDSSGETQIGQAVFGAVAMLTSLDKAIHDATNDEMLSEVGRARKLEKPRVNTLQAIGRHWQNVDAEELAINARHTALFAIPKIEPTDAVTAIIDREIRDYVRGIAGDERSKLIRSLGDPEHARMVLALCRSPVTAGIPEKVARDAWTRSIKATRSEEVAKIEGQLASVQWARAALSRCAALAAQTAKMDRGRVIAALRAADDLKNGAHRAYGIHDADWKAQL